MEGARDQVVLAFPTRPAPPHFACLPAPTLTQLDSEKADIGSSEKMVIPDRFKARSPLFDFCLVVEETEIWVPKLNLALASPVLEAMVCGDFKEAADAKVQLRGKKVGDILVFLYWLLRERLTEEEGSKTYNHAGRAAGIATEDVPTLLRLSDELQVERLKDDCNAVFNCFVRDAREKKTVMEALKLADKFEQSAEVTTELLTKVLRYNVTLADLRTLPQLGARLRAKGWLENMSAARGSTAGLTVMCWWCSNCGRHNIVSRTTCEKCSRNSPLPQALSPQSTDLPYNKSGKDCETCKASSFDSDFCACLPDSWK